MTTSLYRMYGDAWPHGEELLYVGISKCWPMRFDQHRGNQPWWTQVTRIDVEHYESRDEAASAEREAIRAELPVHNQVHARSADEVWDYLCELDPELANLAECIRYDVWLRDYCGFRTWFEGYPARPAIKTMLAGRVGWYIEGAPKHPVLATARAYRFAYSYLHSMLPPCDNPSSCCLGSDGS